MPNPPTKPEEARLTARSDAMNTREMSRAFVKFVTSFLF